MGAAGGGGEIWRALGRTPNGFASGCVGTRDPFWIARVPGVLGHAHLLGRGLQGERRQRWSRHGSSSQCARGLQAAWGALRTRFAPRVRISVA
jgi:hypothetical protein